MSVRSLLKLTVAAGLWVAPPLLAGEPARLTVPGTITQVQDKTPMPPAKIETGPAPAKAPIEPPSSGLPLQGIPMGALPPGAIPGPGGEPIPIATTPIPGPHDANPPRLPPYAWPTYAPYNNYSRVAYPEFYPPHAFPFIGPFYPFPHPPLGWRKVQLEWVDGHWWYKRLPTKHDWWRLKYW